VLYNKDCVSDQAIVYWHQKGSKPQGRQHFLKATETLVKVRGPRPLGSFLGTDDADSSCRTRTTRTRASEAMRSGAAVVVFVHNVATAGLRSPIQICVSSCRTMTFPPASGARMASSLGWTPPQQVVPSVDVQCHERDAHPLDVVACRVPLSAN
jgi:hypothetical protein